MPDSSSARESTSDLSRLRAALADRYRFERELGHGGNAVVYLAHDLKHQRSVAVKVLAPELALAVRAGRFLREIEIAARLAHPHILPVHDSGEADGFLYYVMPYVEGNSLRQRLHQTKQLPVEEALAITREVAGALSYAHSRDVVHRDIKPENILLQSGHAIVADFGIARAITVASGRTVTEAGVAVGTPVYMSPEQGAASGEIDGRSDVYSLGCVLYEMLSGHPPFTGASAQEVLARHSLDPVPSLRAARPDLPAQVERAVVRALAKAPVDRFATATEFSAALSSPIVVGDTAPVISGSRPFPLLLPRLSMALAAGAIVVAAAGGWWLTHRGDARVPAGPDPRRIAVRYFDDLSQDGTLRSIADGLTEGLIHQLSEVKTLQVVSRNGVAPYRGSHVTTDSIARGLGVGTIVEGSVAQAGAMLRVTVALIDSRTGTEIGSTNVQRTRQDVFALQDTLVHEVAVFLRRRLGEVLQLQAGRIGTSSAQAWELVQEAHRLQKDLGPLIAAGDVQAASRQLDRGDSLLAQAETADPHWVVPVTTRGTLAYRQSRPPLTTNRTVIERRTREALQHVGRALHLAPRDADALELRGTVRYWRWLNNLWDGRDAQVLLDSAEADLRAAVVANPSQAQAWASLAHLLTNKSGAAEAKLASLRAYESDPYLSNADVILWRLFTSSYDLEDRVEAKRWCDEGHRRFPSWPRFTECRLWLLTFAGQRPDPQHAWNLLAELVKNSPPSQRAFNRAHAQMAVAAALVRAGLPDSGRAVALRSRSDATIDPTGGLLHDEVFVRTLLGDHDEAIGLLARFLAINPQRRGQPEGGWWFRDLENDPRYKALWIR